MNKDTVRRVVHHCNGLKRLGLKPILHYLNVTKLDVYSGTINSTTIVLNVSVFGSMASKLFALNGLKVY